MTETTHTLIEDAANLIRAHGCNVTAGDLIDCKCVVPNVPVAARPVSEKQILDAIEAMSVPDLGRLLAALQKKFNLEEKI